MFPASRGVVSIISEGIQGFNYSVWEYFLCVLGLFPRLIDILSSHLSLLFHSSHSRESANLLSCVSHKPVDPHFRGDDDWNDG
jgi:hypothetical protein